MAVMQQEDFCDDDVIARCDYKGSVEVHEERCDAEHSLVPVVFVTLLTNHVFGCERLRW